MTNIPDCPFCNPEILADSLIVESKLFAALYNVSPILPGHTLVIPRRHATSLMDLTEPELCEYMRFGRRVMKHLLAAYDAPGFNLTVQDSSIAGQTVSHLHMHLIPRVAGDLATPGAWYPLLRKSEAEHEIDSSHRPRLSKEAMAREISRLQPYFSDLK